MDESVAGWQTGHLATGTVERDNIAGWVRSLQRAFNLEAATEESDQIVLRSR